MAKNKSDKQKPSKGKSSPSVSTARAQAAEQRLDRRSAPRRALRLVVFLVLILPSLTSFAQGSLDATQMGIRAFGAALFALMSVGLVLELIDWYRSSPDRPDESSGTPR